MGLIYFDGGPLDAHVYETETLLSKEALGIPVYDYNWTSEKKTSQNTGAVAQIWRFKGKSDPSAVQSAPTPAATPPPAPHPIPTALNGVAAPDDTTRVPVQASAPDADAVVETAAVLNDPAAMEGITEARQEAAASMPVPVDAPVAAGDTSPEGLLERRKALKLSRKEVSDRSGLAQSKIDSIEKGTGKRTKPEEIEALAATLTAFENERAGN